ncbi:MAG: DUF2199 domain-containing protein [Thermoplasmata archaeon]|nr:DUF2199 domain-containing protein [Thermoplasmata archaeon]
MSGNSSPNTLALEPTTHVRVVNERGEVVLAADLPVLYRAQRRGKVEIILGAGRARASLTLPVAMLVDIPDDETPPTAAVLQESARKAEDHVLSRLEL